jgi:hypothetical protein
MRQYHIISRHDKWAIKKPKALRAIKLFDDRQDAINHVRKITRGCVKN